MKKKTFHSLSIFATSFFDTTIRGGIFKYEISKFDRFIVNCLSYKKRSKLRVILDAVIWLLTPAVVSGFFYVKIAIALCRRTRNATRNTTLTICFAISWVMWLICWIPNYLTLIFSDDSKKVSSMFMVYFILFRTPLQMTYSHLNPVIFIIVMKPFQNFLKKVSRKLCMRHSAQQRKNEKANSSPDSSKKVPFKVAYGALFVTLLALLAIQASGSVLKVSKSSTFTETMLFQVRKKGFASVQKSTFMKYMDLMQSRADPRNGCGSYHGEFGYSFKRCFIVQEHQGIGLNFTEQVESCSKSGAVLFYARTKKEVDFVWNSIYIPFRAEPYTKSLFVSGDWFLHMGYVITLRHRFYNVFTSVDGKMNISFESHSWFHFFIEPEMQGPSVCMLEPYFPTDRSDRLYPCLPRMKARFSVCSVEFVDLEKNSGLM